MRTVSWFFPSAATYQATGRASWTLWDRGKCTHQNFVNMFLRCDVEALGKSRTDKPSGPFRRHRYEQEATQHFQLYACEHRWLDNSSVISDSMRHKPKGIPSQASTQPIKIQEEGIPLWPNKGVLTALPQEPSFGRFFAGFGRAWLSSPRRPSSSYRFFEAFRPNRRSHNPPIQIVLSGHRKARRRQLRQPNRWTKRSLWHGSLTAPRS